jgi:hypothetical protein
MRVAAYLAKFTGSLDFEPALVNVKRLDGNRHLVVGMGWVGDSPLLGSCHTGEAASWPSV